MCCARFCCHVLFVVFLHSSIRQGNGNCHQYFASQITGKMNDLIPMSVGFIVAVLNPPHTAEI